MQDLRYMALAAITVIVFSATIYSIVNHTYLDTSNPTLTVLAHPLGHSHYFASKKNTLNIYFIKWSWAWTTVSFFLSWITSPASSRTGRRVAQWVIETLVWFTFVSWFFGPALLERLVLFSGGECGLSLPSGDYITLPQEFCFKGALFSPTEHPEFFTAPFALAPEWRTRPRLRKGHDVSGHIFLLTMSTLFLVDQLRPSLRERQWTVLHTLAITAKLLLIATWLFSMFTTSLYFHTPREKITGLGWSYLFPGMAS